MNPGGAARSAADPLPIAGPGARFLGTHDRDLLVRIEDAGLNASAPPQQRWMDGWLVRTNPGKAQRARCINAVAAGRRPVADKLAACEALFHQLQLPMLVRVTPFTEPAALDADLAARGYAFHDETRVMVLPNLRSAELGLDPGLPPGTARWQEIGPDDFAEAVGALRGSAPEVRLAHAQRLRASPVPYRGFVLCGSAGEPLACGQVAAEANLVGLYDIVTAPQRRQLGLGAHLCKRLLTLAKTDMAACDAYLQVGADNHTARRIYAHLGFEDAFSYHYRMATDSAAS